MPNLAARYLDPPMPWIIFNPRAIDAADLGDLTPGRLIRCEPGESVRFEPCMPQWVRGWRTIEDADAPTR